MFNPRVDIKIWTILPTKLEMIYRIFVIIFIPLFELIVYPILAKIGIRQLLQKISLGIFLASLVFVISAVLQIMSIVSIIHDNFRNM